MSEYGSYELKCKLVKVLNQNLNADSDRGIGGWYLGTISGYIFGPGHTVTNLDQILPIVHPFIKDTPLYAELMAEILGQNEH